MKSKKANQLVNNLEATISRLPGIRIKLNPDKCVFGVPKGKLLVFIVSKRGYLEANGILGFPQPLHSMTWRARHAPLQLLKKSDHFTWMDEAQEAFEKLKALLAMAPTLVAP